MTVPDKARREEMRAELGTHAVTYPHDIGKCDEVLALLDAVDRLEAVEAENIRLEATLRLAAQHMRDTGCAGSFVCPTLVAVEEALR